MVEKATVMVLKVDDLQCSKCYKKVKKILCKFPEIRNQEFDEKSNTVTITVVCCNPEKIRDKLCCKGCGTIKSIDIKDKEQEKTGSDKLKPEPKEKTVVNNVVVVVVVPPPDKPKEKKDVVVEPPPDKPKENKCSDPPPLGYPQYPAYYCLPYYDWPCHQPPPCHCGCGGRSGHAIVGPCRQPPPCHCGCGGRSGRDAYGGGYCSNRCDY